MSRGWVRWGVLGVWMCVVCAGRGEESPWHSAHSADRRFVILGQVPEWVQGMSVWTVRGVRLLEGEIGTEVPFRRESPLRIVLHPEAERTRLRESIRGGVHRQEIITPGRDVLESQALADAFTRACLNRVLWREQGGASPPQAPDWLVYGLSHRLLEGETERLAVMGLGLWKEGRMSSPRGGTRERADSAEYRAHCLWSVRLLFRRSEDWGRVWMGIREGGEMDAAAWVAHLEDVEDVRELHVIWDLWMSTRGRAAIAELGNDALARERLEELLDIRLAEFGVEGEAPRYETLSLEVMREYLDEPWARAVLQRWMMRLQPVRFRQSSEFVEEVDHLLEAAGHLLRAVESRGRARERALEDFGAAWAKFQGEGEEAPAGE